MLLTSCVCLYLPPPPPPLSLSLALSLALALTLTLTLTHTHTHTHSHSLWFSLSLSRLSRTCPHVSSLLALTNSPPVFYISDSGRTFDCHILCGRLGIPLSSCSLSKAIAPPPQDSLTSCLISLAVKCEGEGAQNTMVSKCKHWLRECSVHVVC